VLFLKEKNEYVLAVGFKDQGPDVIFLYSSEESARWEKDERYAFDQVTRQWRRAGTRIFRLYPMTAELYEEIRHAPKPHQVIWDKVQSKHDPRTLPTITWDEIHDATK
jgi:hypothetical protein